MIELYTASTFNGQRAAIMLEETGLDYVAHRVDLWKGEQRRPAFLKLNPSGRIPVLLDYDSGESAPFILTQSVAIVQYLAEKTGRLLPHSLQERARVYEWLQFHAVDIGSSVFSAFYLKRLCSPRQHQAARLITERVIELYSHFDRRLADHEFLAGANYSIADIIAMPAALAQQEQLADYAHLTRWLHQLKQRPEVQRGLAVAEQEPSHES